MYMPISRINAASLNRSPYHGTKASAGPAALSFPETLAAVASAIEDQAQRIRKKYGLSVRITGKESAGRGVPNHHPQEIVIAPNILQQMSQEPAVQRKIYGYIEEYLAEDAGEDHRPLSGGLIIYGDGTCSWPASVPVREAVQGSKDPEAVQADGWSGSSAQERLQQLAFIRARRSHREP